jgi:hypothetical protein
MHVPPARIEKPLLTQTNTFRAAALEKIADYQALAAVFSGKDMLGVSWLLLPEGNADLPKLIMANESDK